MTPTSPFDTLPSDRGDDAVWCRRILTDLPFAGNVLNNPIHKGYSWRASVGLRSTRLLLCGAPRRPTSTPGGNGSHPAWDTTDDIKWPPTNAVYTPTALAKEPHASMWGPDVGPAGRVLHDNDQPLAIVEVHHVSTNQNVRVIARDVNGGLWLRDTLPGPEPLSYPGLVRLALPFRAVMAEPTAQGLVVLDDKHGLWEFDPLYCAVIPRKLPPLAKDERVSKLVATGGAGIVLLTTHGGLWWGHDATVKHFENRQCTAWTEYAAECELDGRGPGRARPTSPRDGWEWPGLNAFQAVRRMSRGSGGSRSPMSPMSPPPPPPFPGRCTHPVEVVKCNQSPGWHKLRSIPGTGRGSLLSRVVDVAKTGIDPDRQLVVALTSAGDVWARMADSLGRAAHDAGSATQEAGWEFLPHMSSNTMTHVTAGPSPHLSAFRTPYVSIAAFGASDVLPGESPLRIARLGASDLDKLGLARGVGPRITSDHLPPFLADTGVAEVALGRNHTVVLTHAGEMYIWGDNENGQCGLGRGGGKVRTPTKVPLAPDETETVPFVVHVSVSDWGTCAVTFPPVPSWLCGNAGPESAADMLGLGWGQSDDVMPKGQGLRASLRRSLSNRAKRFSLSADSNTANNAIVS
ncbi:hypothetical protein CcaverHIS002_0113570 [Cutaneotrichosporon cavernicola]|uniref:RCC1/BLIP-II protein n=1 Tax=Cutaneotrichosporon cavernicola TaxID=279322 RepID=A0AA48KZH1_9TREE|nr:uncharacterized protein CcaverHIS019_0113440 [Cutaneotrichosporon cavernicola]BEI80828.1 hypothetical protein CcaverHIS002_0113570 [Cutaneotrichosporon cavernicola]BEI88626.1 hypothetical protein CcaverHIS019_0113440 [Cutaneotrichosporon cavernicola]BEI96399.1 hypothetical protein CcaverHIS631_0113480 [Cutaneotrichosporon cavernicola]BEJ04171.1 hypothetical protein CcaverHIS641_0113460 [Cutaneotrichosporon cavernicola]